MQDIVFLKINVDECEDIAAEYEITSMPTFVFVKEGKVVRIKYLFKYCRKNDQIVNNQIKLFMLSVGDVFWCKY